MTEKKIVKWKTKKELILKENISQWKLQRAMHAHTRTNCAFTSKRENKI